MDRGGKSLTARRNTRQRGKISDRKRIYCTGRGNSGQRGGIEKLFGEEIVGRNTSMG